MKRVVSFYEKLPRGPAPEIKPTGLFGRYQAKHFGKNPTGKRTCQVLTLLPSISAGEVIFSLLTSDDIAIVHAIALILVVGYPMTYYFHLRKSTPLVRACL